jgi:hypothetical protein
LFGGSTEKGKNQLSEREHAMHVQSQHFRERSILGTTIGYESTLDSVTHRILVDRFSPYSSGIVNKDMQGLFFGREGSHELLDIFVIL